MIGMRRRARGPFGAERSLAFLYDEENTMQLELSSEDRSILEQILENAHAEMRVEVRRTSTPKYHDDLEANEARVKSILERVKALGS